MKGKTKKYLAFLIVFAMVLSANVGVFKDVVFAEDSQGEELVIGEGYTETPKDVEIVSSSDIPYEINYLDGETDEEIVGLDSITGEAALGDIIEIKYPEIEGYKVLEEQPESIVIVADNELNKVNIYYEQIMVEEPIVVEDKFSTVSSFAITADAPPGLKATYLADSNVLELTSSSNNDKTVIKYVWTKDNELYIAVAGEFMKEIVTVEYGNSIGSMQSTSFVIELATNSTENLNIKENGSYPVPNNKLRWAVISFDLTGQQLSAPFYLSLITDKGDGGHGVDDAEVNIVKGYVVNYYIEGTTNRVPGIILNPYLGYTTTIGIVELPVHPITEDYIVKPGEPTEIDLTGENDYINIYYIPKEVDFTVQHYLEDDNGNYPSTPYYSELLSGLVGSTVYDDEYDNSYSGWTYEQDNDSSAVILSSGLTILKLYYTKDADVTINYVSADPAMGTVAPASQTLAPVAGTATGSTADPKPGYHFVNWTVGEGESKAVAGTNATLSATEVDAKAKVDGIYVATTFIANFEEDADVTINYVSADPAKGSVAPASQTLAPVTGTATGSTADPKPGYHFVNWTVGEGESKTIVGSNATLSATEVDAIAKASGIYVATTFTANFAQNDNVTLTYVSADPMMGSVTPVSQILAPATGIAEGSTATPELGCHFVNWTVGETVAGTDATLSVADVDAIAKESGIYVATTFTANFAEDTDVTLTYVSADPMMGSVTPTSQILAPATGIAEGSTATPELGYHFVNWIVGEGEAKTIVGSNATLSAAQVDAIAKASGIYVAKTFTANFAEDTDVTINYVSADPMMGSVTPVSQILAPATGIAEGSTATPELGYHFVNWTVGETVAGTDATLSVAEVDAKAKESGIYVATTFTANFAEDTDVTLTYVSADPMMGSVTPTSQTLAPVTGTATGSTADPKPGYHFVNWTVGEGESKAIVGSNATLSVADVDAKAKESGIYVATTFTANFAEDTDVTLTYVSADPMMGSVTPTSQILAPATGIAEGSTATPELGYHFVNWTVGETVAGTDATLSVADVDAIAKESGIYVATTFTANFAEDTDVTINYVSANTAMGTVNPENETLAPATGTAEGSKATPKPGYHFVNWTVGIGEVIAVAGTNATLSAAEVNAIAKVSGIYEATTFTANFERNQSQWHTVTFVAGTNGSITGTASFTNILNDTPWTTAVDVPTPVPNSGYRFSHWSPVFPLSVLISDIYTANFERISNPPRDRDDDDDDDEEEIIDEAIPEALPELNKEDHFQYIQGYPDNTVRPEGLITREEVSAVFYRLLTDGYRSSILTSSEDFPDVDSSRWSLKHIATLANGSIIEGYPDGSFKPGNFITRAELATIASRFDNLSPFESNSFSDIDGHWANKYINSASIKGWVNGYPDGTFKPNQYITRAEFVTLVNNVLERRVREEAILAEAKQFTDLLNTKWYYEAMQEAINSHLYIRLEDTYEGWTEIYNPILDM